MQDPTHPRPSCHIPNRALRLPHRRTRPLLRRGTSSPRPPSRTHYIPGVSPVPAQCTRPSDAHVVAAPGNGRARRAQRCRRRGHSACTCSRQETHHQAAELFSAARTCYACQASITSAPVRFSSAGLWLRGPQRHNSRLLLAHWQSPPNGLHLGASQACLPRPTRSLDPRQDIHMSM